jgi:hypothetical protein
MSAMAGTPQSPFMIVYSLLYKNGKEAYHITSLCVCVCVCVCARASAITFELAGHIRMTFCMEVMPLRGTLM